MPAWSGNAERARFARTGFSWFPKPYQNLTWALKLNGSTIPRADIFGLKYSHAVTDEHGQCNIEINNNAGSYSYTGGESIEIYVDFSDASTLRWKGKIERAEPAFQGMGRTIKITGRYTSANLMDITVTKSYTDTAIEDILDEIVAEYASGFTYTKATYPCSTVVSVNWESKPFWECVVDLCNLAGYDVYVNTSDEFVFKTKGSTITQNEAMVHDNVIDISGIGIDIVKIRNRIIVNGEDADGNPIVYTKEDTDSQSTYNSVKEKVITDTSIRTVDDAKKRAEAELELLKDAEIAGEATSMLLVDFNPGEKIWISYPMLNIHNTYRVVKYENNLYSAPPKTKVWINSVKKIPNLFRRLMATDLATETIRNPEQMKFSFNMTFDDESQIYSNTSLEVSSGVLKTVSGKGSGTMISETTTTTENITVAYVVVKGNGLSGGNIEYHISNNGGISYEAVTPKSKHTFTTTGTQLRLKVVLLSDVVELDSIVVMYT